MTLAIGRTTRVIGWYHSHPHITVLPSHVDVRTQAMYQLLDSGFIGLIFSCFSEDAQKVGRIQVTAFQSSDGKQNHTLRPVSVSPVPKSSVVEIESSLSSSEKILPRSGSSRRDGTDEDTGDSKASSGFYKAGGRSSDLGGFFANADARTGENRSITVVDVDPMDMSESMQEAMHRSNLEMSGAEFVRKEVPLFVQPASTLINLDSPLASFADLQRVLYDEERSAYNQAIEQNMRGGLVHPLTYIHHTSTYQASMCKLMEYCLSPAIHSLQVQLKENEIRMKGLADEAKILESEVSKGSETNSTSPRPSRSSGGSFGHRDLYSPPRNLAGSGSRSRKGS